MPSANTNAKRSSIAMTSCTSSTSPTATPTETRIQATCPESIRKRARASSLMSVSNARFATLSASPKAEQPPYEIYVKEKAILNRQHDRAWQAVEPEGHIAQKNHLPRGSGEGTGPDALHVLRISSMSGPLVRS